MNNEPHPTIEQAEARWSKLRNPGVTDRQIAEKLGNIEAAMKKTEDDIEYSLLMGARNALEWVIGTRGPGIFSTQPTHSSTPANTP